MSWGMAPTIWMAIFTTSLGGGMAPAAAPAKHGPPRLPAAVPGRCRPPRPWEGPGGPRGTRGWGPGGWVGGGPGLGLPPSGGREGRGHGQPSTGRARRHGEQPEALERGRLFTQRTTVQILQANFFPFRKKKKSSIKIIFIYESKFNLLL